MLYITLRFVGLGTDLYCPYLDKICNCLCHFQSLTSPSKILLFIFHFHQLPHTRIFKPPRRPKHSLQQTTSKAGLDINFGNSNQSIYLLLHGAIYIQFHFWQRISHLFVCSPLSYPVLHYTSGVIGYNFNLNMVKCKRA